MLVFGSYTKRTGNKIFNKLRRARRFVNNIGHYASNLKKTEHYVHQKFIVTSAIWQHI